jgi:hypothetical protein
MPTSSVLSVQIFATVVQPTAISFKTLIARSAPILANHVQMNAEKWLNKIITPLLLC